MADAMQVFRERRLDGSRPAVDETISEEDEMLLVLRERLGDDRKARMTYLAMGHDLVRTVEDLARWRFGDRAPDTRVLEFAAGHGRNVRHLVRVFAAQNVTVSDIQPDALRFCERQFGVSSFASVHDPAQLTAEGRYELIVVPSLFSHLPDATFGAWIRALHRLLADDGLLVFSVHGSHLQPPAERAPSGITFVAESESRSLDKGEYGTSHVSAAYVGARIAAATGHQSHALIRRGFWNHQDVFLVPFRADPSVDEYEHDHGVLWSVDIVRLTVEGHLELSGWATTLAGDGSFVQVRVSVDDMVVAEGPAWVTREQVAAAWGPAGRLSGFWFLIPNLARFRELDSTLVVEALTPAAPRCLWAGPLGAALTADDYSSLASGASERD